MTFLRGGAGDITRVRVQWSVMSDTDSNQDAGQDHGHDEPTIDVAARRAWIMLGVLIVVFLLGLVMVSFWGGPFESTSLWQHDASSAFPN